MTKFSISTVSGHLTAANKKAISQMLAMGITEGHTPKISYKLENKGDVWEVVTSQKETNDYGKPFTRQHRATFTAREAS